MRKPLSILAGKSLITLARLTGSHGSAMPGAVAEKLDPKLLKHLLGQLPEGLVMVTGTNGKTTTTKALVTLLESQGKRVLTNKHGSNYTRGILSSLIEQANLQGQLNYDIAVLEVDEAYTRVVAKQFAPRWLVVLNVMRDQLDRYGEVDTTAKKIGLAVEQVSEGAVLNLHDQRVADLEQQLPKSAKALTFNLSPELAKHLPAEAHHKSKSSSKAQADVLLESFNGGKAKFRINSKSYEAQLRVAGLHNASNLSAALAAALAIVPEAKIEDLITSLQTVPAAFGRGEVVKLGETDITLALVKNPAGFAASLKSYAQDGYDSMMFAVNDQFADGRDVSWLWDVDYSELPLDVRKVCSGVRGYDMALRLQYDDRPADVIALEFDDALKELRSNNPKRAIIFCTYTSMLAIRKQLAKQTDMEAIWE